MSLKVLTELKLHGRAHGAVILQRYVEGPQAWSGPMTHELTAVDAAADPDLVNAAQALMRLLDEAGLSS